MAYPPTAPTASPEPVAPAAPAPPKLDAAPEFDDTAVATMLQDRTAGAQQALRTGVVQGSQQAPDHAAAVLQLSDQTGIPADVVNRHFDDIQKQHTFSSVPYDQILKDTPATAAFLSDPAQAAVVGPPDEMAKLGALEWLLTAPSRAVSQAINDQRYGALRTKSLFGTLTPDEMDQMAAYKYHAEDGGRLGAGDSWFRGAITGAAKLGVFLGSASPYAIAGGVGGAIIGGIGGSVLPGPGTVAGAAEGGALGFHAGEAVGLSKLAFETSAGPAYDQFLGLKDEYGRAMDPDVAKGAALAVGAINAALMGVSGEAVLKQIPGASRLTSALTSDAVAAALRVPTIRTALAQLVKTSATTLGTGTALVVGQQAVTILGSEIAKTVDAHFGPPSQVEAFGNRYNMGDAATAQPKGNGFLGPLQRPDGGVMSEFSIGVQINGKETEIPTLVPTLSKDQVAQILAMKDGDPLPAGVEQAAIAYAKGRMAAGKDVFAGPGEQQALYPELPRLAAPIAHRTASDVAGELWDAAKSGAQSFALAAVAGPALSFVHEASRASQAQAAPAFVTALGEAVTQSETAKRSPATLQKHLEAVTKDGPRETVYAPLETWDTYWQGQGVDPAVKAAEVTGDPVAYHQAQQHGGDLPIPTARYAVTLAGTDHNAFFANELRLGVDEMNGREQAAFQQAIQTMPTPEPGAPVSAVRAQLLEQLTKGGQIAPATAEKYADLFEAVGSAATRAGVDPTVLYNRYGLTVARPVEPSGAAGSARPAARPAAAQTPAERIAQLEGDLRSAQRAAETDSLTGVANRSALDKALPAAEADSNTRVVAFDANNFGQVNKQVSHEAGDAMLRQMADAISQAATEAGVGQRVFRRGGDEFVVLAPAAVADQVRARAEELFGRQTAGQAEISLSGTHGNTFAEADATLQAAKQAAKDAHIVAAEEARQRRPGSVGSTADVAPALETRAGLSHRPGEQPGAPTSGLPAGAGAADRARHGGVQSARPGGDPDEVFKRQPAADTAARLTPDVRREVARIKDELETFPFVASTFTDRTLEPGPKSGNAAGGSADIVGGAAGAPVYGDVLFLAPQNKGTKGRAAAREVRGTRGDVLKAATTLLDKGDAPNNLAEGVLRVAERRAAGEWKDLSAPALPASWHVDPPAGFVESLNAAHDAIDTGGDASFDITKFEQGPKPADQGDLLDTGEVQPRLPGDVGAVQDQNVTTPQLEAPFSLTSEAAKGNKGQQQTLFQSVFHGTSHKFEEFSLHAIGSGEGAQAYGWGLYFASARETAQYYRDALTGGRNERYAALDPNESQDVDEHIRRQIADAPTNEAKGTVVDKAIANLEANIAAGEQGRAVGWGADTSAIARRMIASLRKLRASDNYTLEENKGRVYTVEIPEDPDFLDYDKTASQQSPKVQKALEALGIKWDPLQIPTPAQAMRTFGSLRIQRDAAADIGTRQVVREGLHYAETGDVAAFNAWYVKNQGLMREKGVTDPTGQQIYENLQRTWQQDNRHNSLQESARAASLLLNQQGVAGIRYLDGVSRRAGEGSSNYVVFDEKLAQITHYEQPPADVPPAGPSPDARGAISFGPDRQMKISLFETADLSTFLHETGHFFLEVMGDLADHVTAQPVESLTETQRKFLSDYGTILQSFGVENRADITTAHHEQFARAFEAYLMEGKAPSLELQSAFSSFRAWLLGVYHSLAGLNVTLTPEVRGVFDRLIASDAAIADAEARRGAAQMFLTPEAAGMTPAEFSLYAATVADAHRTATEQLDQKLMADVQREQTRLWKEQRAGIKETVTHALQGKPEYQALAAIQKGTRPDGTPLLEGAAAEPLKLSRAILVERYGEDRLKQLPRPYVYTTEGGLDPDFVAPMFGYSSGDAMLTALEGAKPLRAAIETETSARMLAEHGSLLLDGTLHDKALLAVANDDREIVIRKELAALGRLRRTAAPFIRAGQDALAHADRERAYERRWFEAEAKLRIAMQKGHDQLEIDRLTSEVQNLRQKARGGAATINAAIPPAGVLRDAARERLADTPIRSIKPAPFWSASRRAAQQAIDRAARQDFEGAITAKQQELTNLAFYREAEKQKEAVQTAVEFVRALDTTASRMRIGKAGLGLQDQIDGILDRFDFAKVSQAALDRRGDLRKWIAGVESQGLPVDLPDDLLDESKRRNYQELTVAEFQGVTDGLKQLVHLAQLQNKLLRTNAKATLDELAGTLGASIRDNFAASGRSAPIVSRDRTEGQSARRVDGFFASHVRLADLLREMDGGRDGGPMWEALMRPANEAGAAEADRNAQATRALHDLIETHYPRSEKSQLYVKQEIPAIGESLSKMERLVILLNSGNAGSRDRQLTHEKWTPEQLRAVHDTLNANDLQFAQGVLDYIGTFKPEIAAKQQRVYGIEPTWVEATPIVTAHGEIPGGYFPLKYDDRLSATAARNLDLEAGNLAKLAAYTQATTARGFTKERLSHVDLPIRRDFGPIFEHVGQVIHDLTHHEALIDMGRILAHRAVSTAIMETQGDLVYKQIKATIRDMAFGDAGARTAVESALLNARAGTSIAQLGWNLTTPMLHLSGALPKAIVRVGPEYFARGLVHWMRDAVSMESSNAWIHEHSLGMRERSRTQQRELSEIRNVVGADTGKFVGWVDEALHASSFGLVDKQLIADSYFYLITKSQQLADIPTYLGQYEKSRAAGESEDRAHAIAHQAVLDAFGGGQIKDLPPAMRAPSLKMWTMFYGPFNSSFNLLRASTRGTRWASPMSVGRFAVDFALLSTVPAAMGYGIRRAMGSKGDDGPWWMLKAQAAYLADMMLGVRELAGAIEGYHDYTGPAGAHVFNSLGKLIAVGEQSASKVAEGKPAEALDAHFWAALNEAGGILWHYPAGQLTRTVGGINAILEGKAKAQSPLVVAVAGPAKTK